MVITYMVNLASNLKVQTFKEHEKLEKSLNLLRENFTLEDYKQTIIALYGLYAPLEKELLKIPLLFDTSERIKTHLLRRDIHSLKLENEIVLCSDLPLLKTTEDALGAWYVLEGSTLGGTLLEKHFSQKLGLSTETGLSFFKCYGNSTPARWKEFLEILKHEDYASLNAHLIIQSAQRTFQCFQNWLCPENA